MNKFTILSSLFLVFLGCKNETNMYKCKGIPDVNQAFAYMYFKTENEGYLFGTYTTYEELTEEELEEPNNIPKSTDEANIYKTTDGGENWIKIDSIKNRNFDQKGIFYKGSFYIRSSDFYRDKLFLLRKDVFANVLIEKPINSVYNFFIFNKKVHFTSNKCVNILDKKMNIIDSSFVNLGNEVLPFKNKIYTILYNEDGYANLEEIDSLRFNKIKLPVTPENLVKQNENSILIAGNTITDENEISLVSYDVNTKQSIIIKKFKNYSIIQNLQSNDKAIIGFIGNIKGIFTEYDLLYSLDKGKTWQVKKLEEPNYVRPSCLIDNIIYIYSGGARMQKIVLE